MYKLENNISIFTVITLLSYATFVFYKIGSSFYYGYPIGLVWMDFNSLISTLIQNSIIIIGLILFFRNIFRRDESFIQNCFVITSAIVFPTFLLGSGTFKWQIAIINIIFYVLVFSLSSFIKKSVKENRREIFTKWKIISLVNYFIFVFYLGNYSPDLLNVMYTDKNEMIVSTYGGDSILLFCDVYGNKKLKIESLSGKEIRSGKNNFLQRDWFSGKCNLPLKIISSEVL